MKNLKGYSIAFAGLSDGVHLFEFAVNKAFLTHFEGSLVSEATIRVDAQLEKRSGFMALQLNLQGTVRVVCDVCVEEFDLPITGSERLIAKFVEQIPHNDDAELDIIYLEKGDSTLYVAQYIYELLTLSIPMRIVHPNDKQGNPTCDPTILQFLQTSDESNLAQPEEKATESEEEVANPIWKALQSLKKQ